MENKSSQGGTIDNGISSGNPQVILGDKGPTSSWVGTGSETPYKGAGSGYEGPGKGSATKLNSDDQMPCNCGY